MRAWSSVIGPLFPLALVAGCDLPPPSAHGGPQVLSFTPDPDGGDIDRSTVFRIDLDRRVAPGSVEQGVVAITSGDEYVYADLAIDVVHPAIVVTPWSPLDPDVDYQVVVHALRDLDGHASVDAPPVVFHTSTASTPGVPDTITYDEVRAVLDAHRCVGCHGGPDPILGLDLTNAETIRATALDVRARQVRSSVGGYLEVDVSATMVGMPRIHPGNAARSYLLYVLLGDPHIAGASMPFVGEPASEVEIERVQRWIQAGTPGI